MSSDRGSHTAPATIVPRPVVEPLSPPAPTPATPEPVTVAAPAVAPPVSLEDNTDAIALRSAIAILLNQQRRATRDIETLQQARRDALNHPDAFVRDLWSGRVGARQDYVPSSVSSPPPAPGVVGDGDGQDEDRHFPAPAHGPPPSWSRLPPKQHIVRCPPINWSKYAVVGSPLDRFHAEMRASPPIGIPAELRPDGSYVLPAAAAPDATLAAAPSRPFIAAPYDPLHDHLDQKSKSKK